MADPNYRQTVVQFSQDVNMQFMHMTTLQLLHLGLELGIFEAFAKHQITAPSSAVSCHKLAELTNLNARYVLEWLRGCVCAGYVEHIPAEASSQIDVDEDETKVKYFANPAKLEVLVDKSSLFYAGGILAATNLYHVVSPLVQECFRSAKKPKGLSYADQPPEVATMVEQFTNNIYKRANKFLNTNALGSELFDRLSDSAVGAQVADVGCGTGSLLITIHSFFPACQLTGVEPNKASFEGAQQRLQAAGISTATLINDYSSKLAHNKYDFITCFDVIHDIGHPQPVVNDIFAALKPGGFFLQYEPNMAERLQDNITVGLPAAMTFAISTHFCVPSAMAQADENGNVIANGVSIGENRCRNMQQQAGFATARRISIPGMGLLLLAQKPVTSKI